MKKIVTTTYVFECDDVTCTDVGCDECPILRHSEFGKTSRGTSSCALIGEDELGEFLSEFDTIDSISLTIKPRKKEEE